MAEITSGENLTVMVLDPHEATILEDAFDALEGDLEHAIANGRAVEYHRGLLADLRKLREGFDR